MNLHELNPPPKPWEKIALLIMLALLVACDPRTRSAVNHAHAAPDHKLEAAIEGWREPDRQFEQHLDRVEKEHPGLHIRSWLSAGY